MNIVEKKQTENNNYKASNLKEFEKNLYEIMANSNQINSSSFNKSFQFLKFLFFDYSLCPNLSENSYKIEEITHQELEQSRKKAKYDHLDFLIKDSTPRFSEIGRIDFKIKDLSNYDVRKYFEDNRFFLKENLVYEKLKKDHLNYGIILYKKI